jgi:hypothetical protein
MRPDHAGLIRSRKANCGGTGRRAEARCQMSDVSVFCSPSGCRKPEVRGQRSDVRGRPEVRGRKPEARGQRPEARSPRAEGCQRSDVRCQRNAEVGWRRTHGLRIHVQWNITVTAPKQDLDPSCPSCSSCPPVCGCPFVAIACAPHQPDPAQREPDGEINFSKVCGLKNLPTHPFNLLRRRTNRLGPILAANLPHRGRTGAALPISPRLNATKRSIHYGSHCRPHDSIRNSLPGARFVRAPAARRGGGFDGAAGQGGIQPPHPTHHVQHVLPVPRAGREE